MLPDGKGGTKSVSALDLRTPKGTAHMTWFQNKKKWFMISDIDLES